MRNEIWSLISYLGAPSWFITFSPADVAHPICLYFADSDEDFKPEIRSSKERNLLIARNPVAAARFFDFMVQMFIKHVLGVGEDHPGLYGSTDGYYGTVEQQGRLTLHMHMLLWIRGALSPQEIRNRMMDPTSTFKSEMIAYLEGVHVGEFQTGTMTDVSSRFPSTIEEDTGIHEMFTPVTVAVSKEQGTYQNLTQTLPEPPPPVCSNPDCGQCKKCKQLDKWWGRYLNTLDDLILKSNIHNCKPMTQEQLAKPKLGNKVGDKDKINANQRRGCQNKDGICKACFPREIVPITIIDPIDGSLKVKKLKPNVNTLFPPVTYLLRCNTDVTSLLSGTAIKAIVAYISDYVTKQSLKTYQVFGSVSSVFQKNAEMLGRDTKRKEKARRLILQIVNSLTSRLEIGSPLASLYMLGNPDHYTSHKYVVFWWKSYVSAVRRAWPVEIDKEMANIIGDDKDDIDADTVILDKQLDEYVGTSNVDDYIY